MIPYSNKIDLVLNHLKSYSVKKAEDGKLFTLSSGKLSSIYLDLKKTILHHRMHQPLADLIDIALREFSPIDCVGGVALGGCHLASITAMYSARFPQHALNAVYIRKEARDHGTKQLIESPYTDGANGASIVLLEDVMTTGESACKAIHQLKCADFEVAAIICVVDRRERYNEYMEGVPVRSLFKLEDLME